MLISLYHKPKLDRKTTELINLSLKLHCVVFENKSGIYLSLFRIFHVHKSFLQ